MTRQPWDPEREVRVLHRKLAKAGEWVRRHQIKATKLRHQIEHDHVYIRELERRAGPDEVAKARLVMKLRETAAEVYLPEGVEMFIDICRDETVPELERRLDLLYALITGAVL